MIFWGKLTFDGFRQIGQKNAALTAVSFRQLFGFSASWAKHIVQNDYRTRKVWFDFLRCNSLLINFNPAHLTRNRRILLRATNQVWHCAFHRPVRDIFRPVSSVEFDGAISTMKVIIPRSTIQSGGSQNMAIVTGLTITKP